MGSAVGFLAQAKVHFEVRSAKGLAIRTGCPVNQVMPEIRQDPTTREWVIIATERAKRPHEFTSLSSQADQPSRSCVFCRGNESQTPPEVWRLEANGQWRIRVVGNKFPALNSKATAIRHETPPFYRSMDGFGYHEVIIETPEHGQTLASMQEDALVDILLIAWVRKPLMNGFFSAYEILSKARRILTQ
jgi:UDPglucose--hexose-1-phosphate uridylyltransferase